MRRTIQFAAAAVAVLALRTDLTAADPYAEAHALVAQGTRVTLVVGTCPAPAWEPAPVFRVAGLEGFDPGVYDCWKEPDGRHLMRLRPGQV